MRPDEKQKVAPCEGNAPYIFVSYARKDRKIVQPILTELVSRGVRLWWDQSLKPGEVYATRIQERVDACTGLLVFLSPESTKMKAQNWVLSETKRAASAGKEIVPVTLSEFPQSLEWSTLIDHLQMLSCTPKTQTALIEGIFSAAQRLLCVGEKSESPQPPTLSPNPKTAPPSTKDAWISECADALAALQLIFDRIAPSEEPEPVESLDPDDELDFGVEIAKPSAVATNFALHVDSYPHYNRCRELIATSLSLRDQSIPLAQRRASCLSLTEKIPASNDPSLGLALSLCHLYNLAVLLGIHSDERESIGPEVHTRLSRANKLFKGTEPADWNECVRELARLVRLSLRVAQLELAILAGLPYAKWRKLAETKGRLAYTEEWQSRFSEVDSIELELSKFKFAGNSELGVVANAYRAECTLGDWITCCYKDLQRPQKFHALPLHPIDQAPAMQRRGAERVLSVRVRIGMRSSSPDYDCSSTGVLLYHAYRERPKTSWYNDYFFEQEASGWLRRIAQCSVQDLEMFSQSLHRPESVLLLARLLTRFRGDNEVLEHPRGETIRPTLIGRFGAECAKRGEVREQRWTPSPWMTHDSMREFLWSEGWRAARLNETHAVDLLLLAGACDPKRESLPKRGFYTSADERKRITELWTSTAPLQNLRANWLPTECYDAMSDQILEDIRAIFPE
jgi:hypothetical protein